MSTPKLSDNNIKEIYEDMYEEIVREILDIAEDNISKISVEHDADESGKYTYLDYTEFLAVLEDTLKSYRMERR